MTVSTLESSRAMEEIRNLATTAHHHYATCEATEDSDCEVSLPLLKQTARRLVKAIMVYELEEAEALIVRMP